MWVPIVLKEAETELAADWVNVFLPPLLHRHMLTYATLNIYLTCKNLTQENGIFLFMCLQEFNAHQSDFTVFQSLHRTLALNHIYPSPCTSSICEYVSAGVQPMPRHHYLHVSAYKSQHTDHRLVPVVSVQSRPFLTLPSVSICLLSDWPVSTLWQRYSCCWL